MKSRDPEVKAKDLVRLLFEKLNDQQCKELRLPETNDDVEGIMSQYKDRINMETTFKAVDDDTLAASKLKW